MCLHASENEPSKLTVAISLYQPPQPYNFGYKVDDGYGNSNFQHEEGDSYGTKKGSYGYTDAYGIYRQVDYVADAAGFRAVTSLNFHNSCVTFLSLADHPHQRAGHDQR